MLRRGILCLASFAAVYGMLIETPSAEACHRRRRCCRSSCGYNYGYNSGCNQGCYSYNQGYGYGGGNVAQNNWCGSAYVQQACYQTTTGGTYMNGQTAPAGTYGGTTSDVPPPEPAPAPPNGTYQTPADGTYRAPAAPNAPRPPSPPPPPQAP